MLNFREMCGESAFIAEADLTFIKKIGSGSFATGEISTFVILEEISQSVLTS